MNTLTRPHDLIYTDWTLIEPEFDPAKLRARETVFTIGNGYLGTRGSFEEGYPNALTTIELDARSAVINTSDCPILTISFVATAVTKGRCLPGKVRQLAMK
jgi:trehalose/maltose hydrolase-like predicted phosphorylase